MQKIFVFDPTASDKLSSVRGIGRYLQILKENFPNWIFTDKLNVANTQLYSVFINPFFNFLQPPITIKRIAKKQIAVIHDLISLKYSSYFPVGLKGQLNIFLNKMALKNYDLIITDSEVSKKDIIKILKINENKIKVIYPCLPKIFQISRMKSEEISRNRMRSDEIGKIQKRYKQSDFCLYVGDATWNKNLVNLAKAIKKINITCVFVGKVFEISQTNHSIINKKGIENTKFFATWDVFRQRRKGDPLETKNFGIKTPKLTHPWQKELKEFFNFVKNDKRFIFAGFLSDFQLIKIYQQASVNILPSRDEGFGFSYLEASSQGCPSVLSDIPVFKEISKGQALFFDPENPNDIADKIGEIYFNKDLKNQLGQQAKKITKKFSSEKFKTNWQELL